MRNLSVIEKRTFSKIVTWLTLILFICSAVMKLIAIYPKFNTFSSCVLGLLYFLSFTQKKVTDDIRNIFLAILIVGNVGYLLSLFFLFGRKLVR